MEHIQQTEKPVSLRAILFSPMTRVLLMIIVLFIISGILEPNYFSTEHLMAVLVLACFLGIIGVGQTLVILTGGADLSVAYTVTLSACVFAQTTKLTGNGLIGFAAALSTGLLIGLFKGVGVARLEITPMVMTLATNSILMSITYLYTQGVLKGSSTDFVTTIAKGNFMGFRYCVMVWMVIGALTIFLLRKTAFGRKIFAIGSSLRVSRLSGVNTRFTLIGVYVIASLMMTIAGIMLIGYLGYPNYTMGNGYQLISIAAVVIGGTSIMGGHGSYLGTMGGVVIIYLIQSILIILDIAEAGREIVNGVIILLVLFAYGRSKKAGA
ncbi:MAG: ABC transporter permease [Spirochaetales bacterium]|jgi:ribose transport system permease protein|nr:ABC transporter permease [Spirochaetales bacterium]